MSNTFGGLFQRIGSAKPPNEFSPRIPPGTHTVAIERYEPKISTVNQQQVIVEADFTVVDSNSDKSLIGQSLGWAWFPGTDKYGYSEGRARAFIECVGRCISDPTPADQLGEIIAAPGQRARGVVMMVTVTAVKNKDGTPRTNPKGEQVTNAAWTPIPQTLEQVAATRVDLDRMKPLATQPAPAPVQQQAPAAWGQAPQQQQQPAPAAWGQQQAPAPTGWGAPQPAPAQAPAPGPGGSLLGGIGRR